MIRLLLIFLTMFTLPVRAQDEISGTGTLSFQVITAEDTIDYLKVGTDTTTAKPTILFLQGSLPIPLIIDFGNFKHVGVPFNRDMVTDTFNLVIISMPETPLTAPVDQLNDQYSYVTDTSDAHSFREEYLRANYLENYVRRTKAVLDDLRSKSWVKEDEIHLVGHSQGAKIAAVTAAQFGDVASVVLLAFNAYGRYDELIRRDRAAVKTGRITAEGYQQRLDDHYRGWKEIVQDPDNALNGNKSWRSFSISYLPYLQKIEASVFIGYGTEDISSENCDLLPLFFIEHGKENYTLMSYIGWDHNFFDVNNRQAGPNWDAVIEDVMGWIGK